MIYWTDELLADIAKLEQDNADLQTKIIQLESELRRVRASSALVYKSLKIITAERHALRAEVQQLNDLFNNPTVEMIDAIRPILMVVGATPRNLGTWRRHLRAGWGEEAMNCWPTWAKEGPDEEHITKRGMAILLWTMMAAARNGAMEKKDPVPSWWWPLSVEHSGEGGSTK